MVTPTYRNKQTQVTFIHNHQLVITVFILAYSSNTKFNIIRHSNVIPVWQTIKVIIAFLTRRRVDLTRRRFELTSRQVEMTRRRNMLPYLNVKFDASPS